MQTGAPWRVIEPSHWERIGFVNYYQGDPYIVHRVRSKLLTYETPRKFPRYPCEARGLELFPELGPGYQARVAWQKIQRTPEYQRAMRRKMLGC